MKVIYLDIKNNKLPEIKDIEDDLKVFYKLIDCRCVDMVYRAIGDKVFTVICDDEGLFEENPIISAIDEKLNPMFVGNLIISNHDDEGYLTGLSKDDINLILQQTKLCFVGEHRTPYTILQMSYQRRYRNDKRRNTIKTI